MQNWQLIVGKLKKNILKQFENKNAVLFLLMTHPKSLKIYNANTEQK